MLFSNTPYTHPLSDIQERVHQLVSKENEGSGEDELEDEDEEAQRDRLDEEEAASMAKLKPLPKRKPHVPSSVGEEPEDSQLDELEEEEPNTKDFDEEGESSRNIGSNEVHFLFFFLPSLRLSRS